MNGVTILKSVTSCWNWKFCSVCPILSVKCRIQCFVIYLWWVSDCLYVDICWCQRVRKMYCWRMLHWLHYDVNTRSEHNAWDGRLISLNYGNARYGFGNHLMFQDSQLLFVLCPFAKVTAFMFHEAGGNVGGLCSTIWTPCWPGWAPHSPVT